MSHLGWTSTTHDWTSTVDAAHLRQIRDRSAELAPTGALHLVLEVLAYAQDEAESSGEGRATVTLLEDGSLRVVDDGRGTDTRRTDDGRVVRKPVMATRDLRFFDSPHSPLLADGHPRRGISVVAALSQWLLHTSRRADGGWRQRYERGVPVTDLEALTAERRSGTDVHFLPDAELPPLSVDALRLLQTAACSPVLTVDVVDERA